MDQSKTQPAYWGVLPAAGVGKRFGTERPKQYQTLLGRTLLEHSAHALLQCSEISKLVIALSETDRYFAQTSLADTAKVNIAPGGEERSDSVLSALACIQSSAQPSDWVLVHDAVRPCLQLSDVQKLMRAAENHGQGAILVLPVIDTIKQQKPHQKVTTVDRTCLWRALTPQMFRYGMLMEALVSCQSRNLRVTDEAQAVELLGGDYCLVEGAAENIKVTQYVDLSLAEYYLQRI